MHLSRVRPALFAALAVVFVLLLAPAAATAAPPTDGIPLDGTQEIGALPVPLQVFPNGQATGPLAAAFASAEHGAPDLILTLYDDSGVARARRPSLVPFWKEYSGRALRRLRRLGAPGGRARVELPGPDDPARAGHLPRRGVRQPHLGIGRGPLRWYDFRAPEEGMDGSRAAIMVYNIRDEGYWGDSPWYIAGYFASGLNDEIQMNCIFVDSYNWADRIGPDVERPFLYEGTIAHEFEHLIHNDVDGNEDSFIDEGMASLAGQFIYGAASSTSDLAYALYYHRDSLTDWDGELYDYGNTEMWQDYLWERASRGDGPDAGDLFAPLSARIKEGYDPFAETPDKFVDPGDAFTWNLIHDQDNGLQSVANQVGGMTR